MQPVRVAYPQDDARGLLSMRVARHVPPMCPGPSACKRRMPPSRRPQEGRAGRRSAAVGFREEPSDALSTEMRGYLCPLQSRKVRPPSGARRQLLVRLPSANPTAFATRRAPTQTSSTSSRTPSAGPRPRRQNRSQRWAAAPSASKGQSGQTPGTGCRRPLEGRTSGGRRRDRPLGKPSTASSKRRAGAGTGAAVA